MCFYYHTRNSNLSESIKKFSYIKYGEKYDKMILSTKIRLNLF